MPNLKGNELYRILLYSGIQNTANSVKIEKWNIFFKLSSWRHCQLFGCHHITFVSFSVWSKFHVIIIFDFWVMTSFVYKELYRKFSIKKTHLVLQQYLENRTNQYYPQVLNQCFKWVSIITLAKYQRKA